MSDRIKEYEESCIKRLDAIEELNKYRRAADSRGDYLIAHTIKRDIVTISNIPSADVEPVRHGRWKRKIIACGIEANWKCSLCGKEYPFDFIDYDYCPNCGARMDGDGHECE